MDWNNPKHDRARAAYDNFRALDGKFDDNVIIQIKHGPIDFQVREPASPLFGTLEKTNQAIELQITQEYFGQARQAVFLVPMWKEALDFDLRAARRRKALARQSRGRGRLRRVSPTSASTKTGSAIICRRPTSTASAGSPGIRISPRSRSSTSGPGRRSAAIRKCSRRSTRFNSLLADVRKLHRSSRTTDSDRYRGQSLRRCGRSIRAQRLGTVASRRRKGRRHGSHGRHRHGYIGQYRPPVAQVYESLATVRTTCCCSCTMCRTPTSCIPARP